MKPFLIAGFALSLVACAPIANTSRTVLTRPLLSEHTIGGQQYPIIIRGAETVGLTPQTLAQSLRFPPRIQLRTSLRAVQDSSDLINHARLDIAPSGNLAEARLTFLHGDRRIGVGVFTLNKADFADPRKVGSTSATLILSMLIDARRDLRNDDDIIWIPN